MGLFQKAYETYDYHKSLVGKIEVGKSPLLPISHIIKNVQLEISINLDGKFVHAKVLDKKSKDPKIPFEQPTIIPVTIESGSRSGKNPAAHPLSDKLTYLIKSDDDKHKEYMQLLSAWEMSEYGDKKLTAIKKYLEGGTLVGDLVREKILEIDENGKIANKKINSVEAMQCMVRWRVYGCDVEECWRDQELFEKWIAYYNSLMNADDKLNKGICMISGAEEILAPMVPKGIVNMQANAKLISSNDTSNFVFRGRFTDAKQASSVGYDTFQKVFVILQWLANNRTTSFTVADRTFLCWNPKGKPVPKLNTNIFGVKSRNIFKPSDYQQELQETFSGFRNNLPDEEDVVIAAFDAATTGRLAIVYYNELKASDFLGRINSWYNNCYWYYYNQVQSPILYDIVRFAFGTQRGNEKDSKVEVDEKVLKQHMQRMFKCLIEKLSIPFDVVMALTMNASHPQSYNEHNRQKVLSIACAVIKKYYNDKAQKEEWSMSLDKNNCDRSYLFGRLLAIMEKWEIDAMKNRFNYTDDDIRETNANKLWSIYCARPEKTFDSIHTRLEVYLKYLSFNQREYYSKLIGEIMEKLNGIDHNILNKPLESYYLMGYYLQKNDLYTSKKDKK